MRLLLQNIMQIFVISPRGETITLKLETSDTVKNEIHEKKRMHLSVFAVKLEQAKQSLYCVMNH